MTAQNSADAYNPDPRKKLFEFRAYWQRQLQRDPTTEAFDIIEDRLQLVSTFGSRQGQQFEYREFPNHEQREQQLERLQALRQEFWDLPQEILQSLLDAIEDSSYPELQESKARLGQVLSERSLLLNAKQSSAVPDFAHAFCQLLIAPLSVRRTIKVEQLKLFRIAEPQLQQETIKTLILLQASCPLCCALEKDWCQLLLSDPE